MLRLTLRLSSLLFATILVLSGCSGGDDGAVVNNPVDDSVDEPVEVISASFTLSGSVVKGPLANADIYVYPLVLNQSGTAMLLDATATDIGDTNAQAKIQNVEISTELTPPLVVEFVAKAETIDLMTGQAPVMRVMRTVVTQAMLDNGDSIYGSPLTTMAIRTTLAKVNDDLVNAPMTIDTAKQRFIDYLYGSATVKDSVMAQVISTVGFGMDSSIDIFSTPPLLEDTTDTPEAKLKVAQYRAAIEGLAAITKEINAKSADITFDDV
ncbi:MAG: hypothetical protein GQ470_02000, partial [Gammaproteobacteria bacterium]|nr:hypothetical protein [Gammaproteobacteria bacterium]